MEIMIWIFSPHEELVAALGDACPYYDAYLTEEAGATDRLEFSIPGDHPTAAEVKAGCIAVIQLPEGIFRAFRVMTQRRGFGDDGTRYVQCYCEDTAYDELNAAPVIDRRPDDPAEALLAALENSLWEPGVVDSGFPAGQTNFYHESALSCLKKMVETWGGEFQFRIEHDGRKITGRYVDFLRQRGRDTGFRVTVNRNMRSLEGEEDITGLATALYGFGKGEEHEETGGYGRRISFADVEWKVENGDPVDKPLGQEWVGDPEALAAWGLKGGTVHRFGFVIFEEVEDPTELLRLTWEELQKRKAPQVNYKVGLIDLEHTEGQEHMAVRLGDWVSVIEDDLGIEFKARVIKRRVPLREPENTELELGHIQPTMADTINRMEQVADRAVLIGDPISLLDGRIQTLTDELNRAPGYLYFSPIDGILVTDKPKGQAPASAIRLKGGILAIANEWDPAVQDFKWRSFGTGEGFTADLITAGTMLADRIRGGDLYLGGVIDGIGKDGRLFLLDANDEVVAQMDAGTRGFDQLTIGRLDCPNVAQVLIEDVDYYVDVTNGNDENDGLTPATAFKTIQRALDVCPKVLYATCRINVSGSGNWEEFLYIRSYYGHGNLEIFFPGNLTIQGAALIEDCHTRIKIYDALINFRAIPDVPDSQQSTLWILNSQMVEIYRMKAFGTTQIPYVIQASNSYVHLEDSEVWDAQSACIIAQRGTRFDVVNVKGGNAPYGLWASRAAIIGGHGDGLPAPKGTTSNTRSTGGGIVWNGFDFSWTGGTAPPPKSTVTTKRWSATWAGSYEPTYGWRTDYVFQGDPGSWAPAIGNYRGLWGFNANSIRSALNGKTVKSIRIKITRDSKGGYYSSRPAYFYTHNKGSATGSQPVLSNSAGKLASFKPGESKWVNLPVSFGNALKNGTATGIAIYDSSGSQQNYMRFSKSATLEITYQ